MSSSFSGNWESEGALLIAVNSSFAICEFPSGEGIFTIVSSQQQSQLVRLINEEYSILLYSSILFISF